MGKAVVEIWNIDNEGNKMYYKGFTANKSPKTMWRAFANGMASTQGIDIETIRSQRKRRGGKR